MHCKFPVAELANYTASNQADMSDYAKYGRLLVDVQNILADSTPSFQSHRPWMSSALASTLPQEYREEMKSFSKRPYVQLGTVHAPEGSEIRIPISGSMQTLKVRKLFVADPQRGCDGVVLETDQSMFVVFRSATSASTFVKIGASSMLQYPKVLADGVECNSLLGNYYEKHLAEPLADVLQASRVKKIIFLGYSMGAALGQLALYDLVVKRDIHIQQRHVFLASPRIANDLFYEKLQARGVRVRNIVAAARIGDFIHLDPIPLLKGFRDPPEIYLVGQLFDDEVSWSAAAMPQHGTIVNAVACSPAFRNSLQCHAVSIFASFMQTAFGESSMDLHGSYRMLVCNCSLRRVTY